MENDEEKVIDEVEKKEEQVVETEEVIGNNEQEQVETVEEEQAPTEEQNTENIEVEAQVIEDGEPKEKKKLNGYAMASFICSIVGLVIFGMPLGLAAIVTGINGIREFDKETQNNKWMAIAGLAIGIIDVIFVSQYSIMIYNQVIQRYNSYLY